METASDGVGIDAQGTASDRGADGGRARRARAMHAAIRVAAGPCREHELALRSSHDPMFCRQRPDADVSDCSAVRGDFLCLNFFVFQTFLHGFILVFFCASSIAFSRIFLFKNVSRILQEIKMRL